MSDSTDLKQRQREIWSTGDFAKVARRIEPASAEMVAELGVEEGQELLDVACGTGNAAIPAAKRGARVTGLDLTPKLLEVSRRRAAAAGVEIELVEGDAEALPFADDSFDRVISLFGVMFAPDQQRATDELVRVCRPGGRIGFSAWTPTGLVGRMFVTLVPCQPPPPPGFMPPILWGLEERGSASCSHRTASSPAASAARSASRPHQSRSGSGSTSAPWDRWS